MGHPQTEGAVGACGRSGGGGRNRRAGQAQASSRCVLNGAGYGGGVFSYLYRGYRATSTGG